MEAQPGGAWFGFATVCGFLADPGLAFGFFGVSGFCGCVGAGGGEE